MIKLVNLLQEQYVSEDMLKQLALEMGETVTEFLGSGQNGKAYTTASGKVLKLTQDDAEVALASRLRKKRLYKHIINVYDVRPIENLNGMYIILMDKVEEVLLDHAGWGQQWNYIRRNYFGKDMTDKQFMDWLDRQKKLDKQFADLLDDQHQKNSDKQFMDQPDHQPKMYSSDEFIPKILSQRAILLRDFAELRIVWDEAHGGNMGWNKHGNLVHFDAWQEEHYTKGYRTRFNGDPIRRDDGKLDTEINDIPYEKGLNKPLQSFKNRNN